MDTLAGTMVIDETALVERSKNGDRDAFCDLVRWHRAGTINVIYRMCGDVSLAEDAAQISFLRAWQNLPAFKSGTSFRNWVYRIAVNAAVDLLRREKQAVDLDDLELTAPGGSMENRYEQDRKIEHVRQAVVNLPEASRAVIILREYEGLSYQEIADTLEISPGTVMSRLNYARKKLAEILADYLEEL